MHRTVLKSLSFVVAMGLGVPTFGDPPVVPNPRPSPSPAPAPPATVAPPPTPAQSADAVLAAVAAKDVEALRTLALRDVPDPWLVADELVVRGHLDEAEAFAKAAPRPDVERLPAYVTSRRGKEEDAAVRTRLAAATAALRESSPDRALELLGPAPSELPSDVPGIRTAIRRGSALDGLSRLKLSSAEHLRAAAAAERIGWRAAQMQSLYDAGDTAYRGADYPVALAALQRRHDLAVARADVVVQAAMLSAMGTVLHASGEPKQALDLYEKALAMQVGLGEPRDLAATLGGLANVHADLGHFDKVLELLRRALALYESLGDRAGVARSLGNMGSLLYRRSEYGEALVMHERALRMKEEVGDRLGIAVTLGAIGQVHQRRGDLPQALAFHERALAAGEAVANADLVAGSIGDIAQVLQSMGDLPGARDGYLRAIRAYETLGNRGAVARGWSSLGIVERELGHHAAALEAHARAIPVLEAVGDRQGVARACAAMATVHAVAGEPAKALAAFQRALDILEGLDARSTVGHVIGNRAVLRSQIGDLARALEDLERSRKIAEELGDKRTVAQRWQAIGVVLAEQGDDAGALAAEQRAGTMARAIGDRITVAKALGQEAKIRLAMGEPEVAVSLQKEALRLKQELGDRAGAVASRANLAVALRAAGDLSAAGSEYESALVDARDIGLRATTVRILQGLAKVRLESGRAADAIALAREAVTEAASLTAGLTDEEGARARGEHSGAFRVGARAAVAARQVEDAFYFFETGRAGALLASLGARDALRAFAVPLELQALEERARADEARAMARNRKARDGSDLGEVKASREALDLQRGVVREVAERIEREARAASGLAHVGTIGLAAAQRTLGPAEALVLYGLLGEDAAALVLTAAEARLVPLGSTAAIETACDAFTGMGPNDDVTPAIATLRALLVEPLVLGKEVRRLVVCPDGALAYVPFALLSPEREISSAPSATTYGLLLEDDSTRGEGVLALGDPEYSTRPATEDAWIFQRAGGTRLTRLPRTADEARAVGQTVLLGRDATERGLREALAKRTRWRSVHLACHGLVDAEKPAFSSLALTPEAEDDGFLSTLEVFRSRIPADLVVLSACETAKGRVVRGEGILGLTRAFMFAGAPRVICSLWKVDDAATSALMTKFYELWNPKDGKPGLSTVAALRKAQAHVASQEKWKHPYFWAAWVLWGLPS